MESVKSEIKQEMDCKLEENVAAEAPFALKAEPKDEQEIKVEAKLEDSEDLNSFAYECTFPLPESMVVNLVHRFEKKNLRLPMGIFLWETCPGNLRIAVANTHCGSGELELMETIYGCVDHANTLIKLPVDGVECQEPTAAVALKNNGLAFLDKSGFTIIRWTDENGRLMLTERKSFRMLKPANGKQPFFETRDKNGPCFGIFCSRDHEVGTFVNDINRGPVLFWWNPFSGQTRTVEVDINRDAQVRFAKHNGDFIALSDMNRNGFALWIVNLEGKQLKKIDLRQHGVIQPAGVTFDGNGQVLLVDSKGNRILRFDEKGDYVGDVELDVRYGQNITDISLNASGWLATVSLKKHVALYLCEDVEEIKKERERNRLTIESFLPSNCSTCVFVSGLPNTVQKQDISKFFASAGQIQVHKRSQNERIFLFLNKETKQPIGEATVTYEDPSHAAAAIDMLNGTDFNGHGPITVQQATPEQKQPFAQKLWKEYIKREEIYESRVEFGGRNGGRYGGGRGVGRFGGQRGRGRGFHGGRGGATGGRGGRGGPMRGAGMRRGRGRPQPY